VSTAAFRPAERVPGMAMDAPRRLDELLAEAIARPPGPERDAWIDSVCGLGTILGKELLALIEAHEQAGSFLDEPLVSPWPGDVAKALSDEDDEEPGAWVP
jgi:hypothetical protein